MGTAEWRPIGLVREDIDLSEWLAQHNTSTEIRMGIANARSWIDFFVRAKSLTERQRGIEHWQHRLQLLRTKALLMGITLEE